MGETLPTVEFAVTVGDMARMGDQPWMVDKRSEDDTNTIFAFTRNRFVDDQDRVWLIPNGNWFADPSTGASSWLEMQRRAQVLDMPVTDKIQKAVWRGVTWTNPAVRESLVNVTKDAEWADVGLIDWSRENPNTMRE